MVVCHAVGSCVLRGAGADAQYVGSGIRREESVGMILLSMVLDIGMEGGRAEPGLLWDGLDDD